jgi:myosin heavy subunit
MSTRLSLPNEMSEDTNHLITFDCIKLFGEEFGKYCDLKMQEIEGPEWLKNLEILRQQYKTNLSDTAFLLKECLIPNSPLRKILPKSKTFYNDLSILKKVRNESAHSSFKHSNTATNEVVKLFFDVSLELNLVVCIEQYNLMTRRLSDLASGKNFALDPNLNSKLGEIEKQKAEMEDQLIEKNMLLLDKEKKLNLVQKIISESNSTIEDLTKSNAQKTSAYNKVNEDLEKSKKEAEELRQQLYELNAQKESDEITEKEIEKIIASLAGTLSIINEDSPKKLIPKTQLKNPRLEVGSLWNKPKGKRKITLSVGKRDLVDSKTSRPLDYISDESRMELAEDWLRVRPTGGRVFVDEEGNAATLIGESLVYLGNISDFLG